MHEFLGKQGLYLIISWSNIAFFKYHGRLSGVKFMKKNVHPGYQEVLFVDSSTGHRFLCGSTLKTKETEVFEGKEYPICKVSISSTSHPFFTGSKGLVDAEGRVDKFLKRYQAKAPAAPKEPTEDDAEDQDKKEKKAPKAKDPKAKKPKA